jgi:hypothetical protein
MTQAVPRYAGLTVLAAACALSAGCVDRRFVIDSDPPMAVVEANGRPLSGATPTDKQFIYYGTYRFVLKHEGYETLVVDQPVRPPWYEYPPLDFFSENVIPFTIRDVRHFSYPMRPLQLLPPEQVLGRAQELRSQGQTIGTSAPVPVPQSTVVPVPATGVNGPTPAPAVVPAAGG